MNSPELQWLLNATSAPSIVAEQASSIDGARLTSLVISHGLSLQILPFAHALAPDAATSLRRDARRAAMDGLRHRANLSAIVLA